MGRKKTMNRLEAAVRAKGMTVFARIDQLAAPIARQIELT